MSEVISSGALDEGVPVTGRVLDFVGAGVTLTGSANKLTVSIPGGAGASWTIFEADLGTTPKWRGGFTITDAAINTTSKVMIHQAPGPYTGKGTRADEAEMDPLWCVAIPQAGSAKVLWQTLPMLSPLRLGKVWKKVKFMYTVG